MALTPVEVPKPLKTRLAKKPPEMQAAILAAIRATARGLAAPESRVEEAGRY